MEILKTVPVMEHTWYFGILIAWIVFGTCAACILVGAKQKVLSASVCIFVIVAVILLCTVPVFHETGKMQYTIEITEPAQYQVLADKGYTFEKVYETKNIYTIVGDVLE